MDCQGERHAHLRRNYARHSRNYDPVKRCCKECPEMMDSLNKEREDRNSQEITMEFIQMILSENVSLRQQVKALSFAEASHKAPNRGWNQSKDNAKMHIVSEGASEDIVKEDVNVRSTMYGASGGNHKDCNSVAGSAYYQNKGYGAGGNKYQYKGYGAGGDYSQQQFQSYGSHRVKTRNEKKLKPCQFCGETHIWGSENCRAFGQICRKCYKRNHFADVCKNKVCKKLRISRSSPTIKEEVNENRSELEKWSSSEVKDGDKDDESCISEVHLDAEESDVESNFKARKLNRKTFDEKYPCMLKYCPIWFHNEFGQEYMDGVLKQNKEKIETEEEAIFYQQEVENMIRNLAPYDAESEQYMTIVGMLQEGKLSMQEIKEQLNEAEKEEVKSSTKQKEENKYDTYEDSNKKKKDNKRRSCQDKTISRKREM